MLEAVLAPGLVWAAEVVLHGCVGVGRGVWADGVRHQCSLVEGSRRKEYQLKSAAEEAVRGDMVHHKDLRVYAGVDWCASYNYLDDHIGRRLVEGRMEQLAFHLGRRLQDRQFGWHMQTLPVHQTSQ